MGARDLRDDKQPEAKPVLIWADGSSGERREQMSLRILWDLRAALRTESTNLSTVVTTTSTGWSPAP